MAWSSRITKLKSGDYCRECITLDILQFAVTHHKILSKASNSSGHPQQFAHTLGASLVVQWLRLHEPNGRGLGWISDQATRSHMLELSVCLPQLKIPRDTRKIKDPMAAS